MLITVQLLNTLKRLPISEIYSVMKKDNSGFTDILIAEAGLYTKLTGAQKQYIGRLHPQNIYKYDDNWLYIELK